ncbi:MAG: hypothetical protein NXH75_16910 [Halobacteriovoraceae bacterium]|nr:hypothetical protein [Halobacteriovoraceae bacterium]
MRKATYLLILFSILGCSNLTQRKREVASFQEEKSPFEMMGASNTVGMGASLSFEDRISLHLERNQINFSDKSLGAKYFLSFDYFFPTNFSALNSKDDQFLVDAEKLIREWSNSYEHVFLVGVPHYSDEMPSLVRRYIKASRKNHPLRTVLDATGTEEMGPRVERLNELLHSLEKKLPNVHLSSFKPFYHYVERYLRVRRKQARHGKKLFHSPGYFFKDPLHINDKGQAFMFNELFLPSINKTLETSIPPMVVADLPENQVKGFLKKKLCAIENFMELDKCHYWIRLSDKSQYKLKNVKVHIPARFTEENTSLKLKASQSERLWEIIDLLDDQERRDALLNILAISELIDENGETAEAGLMINLVNEKQKLYLDLSKVLFFTTFPTFRNEENSNTFVNWGYDHWLSYKYLYNGFQYSGGYSDKTMMQRMSAPAPGTNYRIKVTVDKEKRTVLLNWRLYATIPDQTDEQSRLEYIPEPHNSILRKNPDDYPYLEYNLSFELDSLD